MDFYGDQGPFDDAIMGVTDSSGWIYTPTDLWCARCGERADHLDGEGWVCWGCGNTVPYSWEEQHEDALVMTVGMLSAS